MKVSAVVLTKNNVNTIDQCLTSLMPYFKKGYITEIVVVDGHSTDGTIQKVNAYPIKLLYDAGKGIANARNTGWKNADGDLIFFVDSDAYLGKRIFPTLIELFREKKIGAIGCRVISIVKTEVMGATAEWQSHHYENLKNLISKNRFDVYLSVMGFSQKVSSNGFLSVSITGPCYAVRRSCLESVGGFGEEHSIAGEELCLSRRIIEKGWRTSWWFDSQIYHHPRDSITGLVLEHIAWGKGDYIYLTESNDQQLKKIIRLLAAVVSRLFSPILGMRFALKYRRPLHIALFTFAHYAWIIGCFSKFIDDLRYSLAYKKVR